MSPLTLDQVRRLAAIERRWLADSAERLRQPVRRLLPTTESEVQEDQR